MRGLQMRIAPVEGVAIAIVPKCRDLVAVVLPDNLVLETDAARGPVDLAKRGDAPLIDIVANMDDRIRRPVGHVAISGVIAGFPGLTVGHSKLGLAGIPVGCLRPADRTFIMTVIELVEILPPRLQPVDAGVDGVAFQVRGRHQTAAQFVAHAFV